MVIATIIVAIDMPSLATTKKGDGGSRETYM
jgi:hypothetical protein